MPTYVDMLVTFSKIAVFAVKANLSDEALNLICQFSVNK